MKIHEVDQGSSAWHKLRLGCLTASRAKPLITATGKVSTGKGVSSLVNELVAETLNGEPAREFSSSVTDRGSTTEKEARAWLAYERGLEIEEVGFITDDAGRVGASPDGLVGTNSGVELKVPLAHTMVGYVLEPERLQVAYEHQVQFSMFVTGRSWWWLAAYSTSPRIPSVVLRVERDEDYLAALKTATEAVTARVDAALAEIERLCPFDTMNPFA